MKDKIIDIVFLGLAIWTIAALYDFLFVPKGYGVNENATFNISGLLTGLILILGQIVRWLKIWADRKKGIKNQSTLLGKIVSIFTILSLVISTIMILYLLNPGPK